MILIQAKSFKTRADLESFISAEVGRDATKNETLAKIEGTRKELKQLHLSDQNTIWGVKVKITDIENTTEALLKKKSGKKLYK